MSLASVAGAVSAAADERSGVEDEDFHFAYRISPILAKNGCSAAECHGGGNGQGGFKLSLFAADPRWDYDAIARELGGRRLDMADPENSLLLKKPSRQLKHKGGKIFREDDQHFEALLRWIAKGAPFVEGEPGALRGIELELGEEGVRVIAEFGEAGDALHEDVTHMALLESTNSEVAVVAENGALDYKGSGEAWILARYGKFSARLPVRRPFEGRGGASRELVAGGLEAVWLQRLEEIGLPPAGRAPEHVLVRRLFMDLTGRPPTPFDLRRYYALAPEERIAVTADRLLASSQCADILARQVGDWFEIPPASMDPRNGKERNNGLRDFFRRAMREDRTLAEITRDVLVNPQGQSAWKHFADPRDRAEYVGRTMLGIRIGCARCHDHPLDRWTNREHLQFAAFFPDQRPAPGGGMMAGKLFFPGTSHEVEPVLLPLGEGVAPLRAGREEVLASFVLERGRDQFARNMANRIFGMLMGRHFVETPDDHRLSNPALHEPLLDYLANEFVENDFELKALARMIVNSDLYALSSEVGDGEKIGADPAARYLARREARPMTPSQFADAVEHVLGVEMAGEDPPDSPLARQLYVMNSGMIQEGLETPGNQVDAIFEFEAAVEDQLDELFELILSRKPREVEVEAFLPVLRDEKVERGRAGRALATALLSSREFGSIR